MLGCMQVELGPAKVPEAGLYLYASRIMNKCLAARQPPEKKKNCEEIELHFWSLNDPVLLAYYVYL